MWGSHELLSRWISVCYKQDKNHQYTYVHHSDSLAKYSKWIEKFGDKGRAPRKTDLSHLIFIPHRWYWSLVSNESYLCYSEPGPLEVCWVCHLHQTWLVSGSWSMSSSSLRTSGTFETMRWRVRTSIQCQVSRGCCLTRRGSLPPIMAGGGDTQRRRRDPAWAGPSSTQLLGGRSLRECINLLLKERNCYIFDYQGHWHPGSAEEGEAT